MSAEVGWKIIINEMTNIKAAFESNNNKQYVKYKW